MPDGKNFVVRGEPEYVRSACEASLKRLDVDYIDLYYQHRVDPKVPIEITVRIALGCRIVIKIALLFQQLKFLSLPWL